MVPRLAYWLIIAMEGAVLTLWLGLSACAPGTDGVAPVQEVGDPAPEFTYLDQTGAEVSLSDYQGHLVLLASAQMW